MKIFDLFEEVFLALWANKSRSGLTILGIVIGIASVISMIAIGQGSQSSIESNIQSLGSNLIQINPGAQRGAGMQVSQGRGSAQTLKSSDAEAIATNLSSLAKTVSPESSGQYQITAKGTNTNTRVVGSTAAYATVHNTEIDLGTFVTEQNVKGMSKVAVLGPTTRDDLFGEGVDPVGQTIKIKQMEFKVIGVTKTKGGSGFNNPDDMIYIPLTVLQKFLSGSDYLSSISVQAIDEESMDTLKQQITDLLLTRHKISDSTQADFNFQSQADILATASSITSTFTILLGSVAAISLLVGGIGIMNMMLTNVTERTKEIGLRKAIGAKRMDINMQFLTEAIVLTFIGGLFGILFGWLICVLITKFASIATEISWQSVGLAFGVSAVIGIVFGYYPAQRAASMNPIEALRYE